MIEYRGLTIDNVDEREIVFNLTSHNVMTLKVFVELGTGYKDGDKIGVEIINEGCTNWSGKAKSDAYDTLQNIRVLFDGNSESEMAATIFMLTAKVIAYRHDGISMPQIAKMIQRRIDAYAAEIPNFS